MTENKATLDQKLMAQVAVPEPVASPANATNADAFKKVEVDQQEFMNLLNVTRRRLDRIEERLDEFRKLSERHHREVDEEVVDFHYTLDNFEKLFKNYKLTGWKNNKRAILIEKMDKALEEEDVPTLELRLADFLSGVNKKVFQDDDSVLIDKIKQIKQFIDHKVDCMKIYRQGFDAAKELLSEKGTMENELIVLNVCGSLESFLNTSVDLKSMEKEKKMTKESLEQIKKQKTFTEAVKSAIQSDSLDKIEQTLITAEQCPYGLMYYINEMKKIITKKKLENKMRKELQSLIDHKDRLALECGPVLPECVKLGKPLQETVDVAVELMKGQKEKLMESQLKLETNSRHEILNFLSDTSKFLPKYDLETILEKWKFNRRSDFIKNLNLYIKNEDFEKMAQSFALYEDRIKEDTFLPNDKQISDVVFAGKKLKENVDFALNSLNTAIKKKEKVLLTECIEQARKYKSLANAVISAESELKRLNKIEETSNNLVIAIGKEEPEALLKLIDATKLLGFPELKDIVANAESKLDFLRKLQKMRKMLKEALENTDFDEGEKIVQNVEKENIDRLKYEVEETKQTISHKKNVKRCKDTITKAISECNRRTLLETGIIDECAGYGKEMQKEVQEARQLLLNQDKSYETAKKLINNIDYTTFNQFYTALEKIFNEVDRKKILQSWRISVRKIILDGIEAEFAAENEVELQKLLEYSQTAEKNGTFTTDDSDLTAGQKKAKQFITEKREILKAFEEAIQMRSIEKISLAIDKSTKFKSLASLRNQGEALIKEIEVETDLRKLLKNALETKDLKAISSAIEKARAAAIDRVSGAIEEAVQKYQQLKLKAEVQKELLSAMNSLDRNTLQQSDLIERSITAGVDNVFITDAKNLILKMSLALEESKLLVAASQRFENVIEFMKINELVLPGPDLQVVLDQWRKNKKEDIINRLKDAKKAEDEQLVNSILEELVELQEKNALVDVEEDKEFSIQVRTAKDLISLKLSAVQLLKSAIETRQEKSLENAIERSSIFSTLKDMTNQAQELLNFLREKARLKGMLLGALRSTDTNELQKAAQEGNNFKDEEIQKLAEKIKEKAEGIQTQQELKQKLHALISARDRVALETSGILEKCDQFAGLAADVSLAKTVLQSIKSALLEGEEYVLKNDRALIEQFIKSKAVLLPEQDLQNIFNKWQTNQIEKFKRENKIALEEQRIELLSENISLYYTRLKEKTFSLDNFELTQMRDQAVDTLTKIKQAQEFMRVLGTKLIPERSDILRAAEYVAFYKPLAGFKEQIQGMMENIDIQEKAIEEMEKSLEDKNLQELQISFAKYSPIQKKMPKMEEILQRVKDFIKNTIEFENLKSNLAKALGERDVRFLKDAQVMKVLKENPELKAMHPIVMNFIQKYEKAILLQKELMRSNEPSEEKLAEYFAENEQYLPLAFVAQFSKEYREKADKVKAQFLNNLNNKINQSSTWEKVKKEHTLEPLTIEESSGAPAVSIEQNPGTQPAKELADVFQNTSAIVKKFQTAANFSHAHQQSMTESAKQLVNAMEAIKQIQATIASGQPHSGALEIKKQIEATIAEIKKIQSSAIGLSGGQVQGLELLAKNLNSASEKVKSLMNPEEFAQEQQKRIQEEERKKMEEQKRQEEEQIKIEQEKQIAIKEAAKKIARRGTPSKTPTKQRPRAPDMDATSESAETDSQYDETDSQYDTESDFDVRSLKSDMDMSDISDYDTEKEEEEEAAVYEAQEAAERLKREEEKIRKEEERLKEKEAKLKQEEEEQRKKQEEERLRKEEEERIKQEEEKLKKEEEERKKKYEEELKKLEEEERLRKLKKEEEAKIKKDVDEEMTKQEEDKKEEEVNLSKQKEQEELERIQKQKEAEEEAAKQKEERKKQLEEKKRLLEEKRKEQEEERKRKQAEEEKEKARIAEEKKKLEEEETKHKEEEERLKNEEERLKNEEKQRKEAEEEKEKARIAEEKKTAEEKKKARIAEQKKKLEEEKKKLAEERLKKLEEAKQKEEEGGEAAKSTEEEGEVTKQKEEEAAKQKEGEEAEQKQEEETKQKEEEERLKKEEEEKEREKEEQIKQAKMKELEEKKKKLEEKRKKLEEKKKKEEEAEKELQRKKAEEEEAEKLRKQKEQEEFDKLQKLKEQEEEEAKQKDEKRKKLEERKRLLEQKKMDRKQSPRDSPAGSEPTSPRVPHENFDDLDDGNDGESEEERKKRQDEEREIRRKEEVKRRIDERRKREELARKLAEDEEKRKKEEEEAAIKIAEEQERIKLEMEENQRKEEEKKKMLEERRKALEEKKRKSEEERKRKEEEQKKLEEEERIKQEEEERQRKEEEDRLAKEEEERRLKREEEMERKQAEEEEKKKSQNIMAAKLERFKDFMEEEVSKDNDSGTPTPTTPRASQTPEESASETGSKSIKEKKTKTHPLVAQLNQYIRVLLKKGEEGAFKVTDDGFFIVPALDKNAVFVARAVCAILSERTKKRNLVKELSVWEVLSELPALAEHFKAMEAMPQVHVLKTDEDLFSLSMFCVFYFMSKSSANQLFKHLFEDEAYLDQSYEQISVLRHPIFLQEFKNSLQKLDLFKFEHNFEGKDEKELNKIVQGVLDELVSDSTSAHPVVQLRGSTKVLGDLLESLQRKKDSMSKQKKDLLFSKIQDAVRKRFCRSLLIVFMDGFKTFKFFGRYYIWDVMLAIIADWKAKEATNKISEKQKEFIDKCAEIEKMVEIFNAKSKLEEPKDVMFMLLVQESLKEKKLLERINMIMQQKEVLSSYYEDDAVIRDPSKMVEILGQVKQLNSFKFNLNTSPDKVDYQKLLPPK